MAAASDNPNLSERDGNRSTDLSDEAAGPSGSETIHQDVPDENVAGPSNSSDERDDQAFDFVLSTDDTSKIRKTDENPPRVAVFDLIAVMTGQRDAARKIYSRLVQTYSEAKAIISFHKFKGRGQQLIPVVPIADVGLIFKAVVPGLRIPMTKKRALLGLHEPLRRFTEIEIHDRITRALGQFTCVPQYRVGKYRLDLFFPSRESGH